MRFKLPDDVLCVMGHTRMTTQGDEKHNYNNHPFEAQRVSPLRWRTTVCCITI